MAKHNTKENSMNDNERSEAIEIYRKKRFKLCMSIPYSNSNAMQRDCLLLPLNLQECW
ncbi:MAG: hypothetical protein NC320_03655 [Clostridium sp.]|nr:hypothetical protein [Clostridium sp.]